MEVSATFGEVHRDCNGERPLPRLEPVDIVGPVHLDFARYSEPSRLVVGQVRPCARIGFICALERAMVAGNRFRIRILPLLFLLSLGAGCNTFFDADSIRPEGDTKLCVGCDASDQSGDVTVDTDSVDVTDTDTAPVLCGATLCEPGQDCCSEVCVDTVVNAVNCGACGITCGDGETCAAGMCTCGVVKATAAPACGTGELCCEDACVSPTDPSCACGAQPNCGQGELCCDDSCLDVTADDANCGACGEGCVSPLVCASGSCSCPTTELPNLCGAECVDVSTNIDHCGTCAKQCNPFRGTPSCTAGLCEIACDTDFGNCDNDADTGCETDLRTDAANCGACKTACSTNNGDASCATSACSIACSPGFEDCNTDVADGCEADLNTDRNHCGGCNIACAFGAECVSGSCWCNTTGDACPIDGAHHDNATCNGTQCSLACTSGYFNCNNDAGDSCEVDTQTDVANCGACGQQCGLGAACVGGECDAIIKISAGFAHTCVLRASGKVLCWGESGNYQTGAATNVLQLSPVLVSIGGTSYTAVDVSAGDSHTCAVLNTGEVWCWGSDAFGQIGDGTAGGNQVVPARSGSGLNNISKVAAGGDHTCALNDVGGVLCWGAGDQGQIGDGGTPSTQATPKTVSSLSGVVEIDAGTDHTCVRLTGGTVKCWGGNSDGQIGNDSTLSTIPSPDTVQQDVSGTKFNLGNVVAIATGGTHSCAVTNVAGVTAMWCWGKNTDGQLGTNSTTPSRYAVNPVTGLTNIAALSAGRSHSCAGRDGGQMLCWGDNFSGQIGDGTSGTGTDRLVPTAVTPTTGLNSASLPAAGSNHTCARNPISNRIYCWGAGGSLGTGNPSASPQPTTVTSLP